MAQADFFRLKIKTNFHFVFFSTNNVCYFNSWNVQFFISIDSHLIDVLYKMLCICFRSYIFSPLFLVFIPFFF